MASSSNTTHRLALSNGSEVGSYRIDAVLGSGGFGITYLATHSGLHRQAAIKELLPSDLATRLKDRTVVAHTESLEEDFEWARERFIDEARTLAKFHHPAIVAVHDIFEANGTAYMATTFEEGCDLHQWIKDAATPPGESEILDLLAPLLDGLATVHAAGMLHRDIKPANIYLCEDGRPILLDFGSARQAISSRSQPITAIVSVGYAPFEQYHEGGNQGPWSDLYAVGAVCHHLITGDKPPDATQRVQKDPCQPLAERCAGGKWTQEFLKAIDWALQTDESDRPQSVEQWRASLPGQDTSSREGKPFQANGPVHTPTDQPFAPAISPQHRVILTGSDLDGERYRLRLKIQTLIDRPDGLVIGRSRDDADLLLNNTSVSRKHARLGFDSVASALTIEDLNSGNGVWIDGREAVRREQLQPSQAIELGEVTLTVEISEPLASSGADGTGFASKSQRPPATAPPVTTVPPKRSPLARDPSAPPPQTRIAEKDIPDQQSAKKSPGKKLKPRLTLATTVLLAMLAASCFVGGLVVDQAPIDTSYRTEGIAGNLVATIVALGLATCIVSWFRGWKLALGITLLIIATVVYSMVEFPDIGYRGSYSDNDYAWEGGYNFVPVVCWAGVAFLILAFIAGRQYRNQIREHGLSPRPRPFLATVVLLWITFVVALTGAGLSMIGGGALSLLGLLTSLLCATAALILGLVEHRRSSWLTAAIIWSATWAFTQFLLSRWLPGGWVVPFLFLGAIAIAALVMAIFQMKTRKRWKDLQSA